MVQAEAQLEQHLALDDAGGDAGVPRCGTDGAEEDGVVPAELLKGLIRQGFAGLQPVLRAELILGTREGDAFAGNNLFQDLDGLGDHFGADAVAGDDCEINGPCVHPTSVPMHPHSGQKRLIIRTR